MVVGTEIWEYLNVVEYVLENLFFCDPEVRVVIFRMGAGVNDPIHVQIKVVKLWDLSIAKYKLDIKA